MPRCFLKRIIFFRYTDYFLYFLWWPWISCYTRLHLYFAHEYRCCGIKSLAVTSIFSLFLPFFFFNTFQYFLEKWMICNCVVFTGSFAFLHIWSCRLPDGLLALLKISSFAAVICVWCSSVAFAVFFPYQATSAPDCH